MTIKERINNLVSKVHGINLHDSFGYLCESETKEGILYGVCKEDHEDTKKGDTFGPEEDKKVVFITYDGIKAIEESNIIKVTLSASIHMYVNPNNIGNNEATFEFGLSMFSKIKTRRGQVLVGGDGTNWVYEYEGSREMTKFEYMVIKCTGTVYLPCDYEFTQNESLC